MIQLRSDCLEFEMSTGETIPCSAETVTIELIGKAVAALDPEIVRHAAAAVLHYFKEELGRKHVTINEFSTALEKVLKRMGLAVGDQDSGEDIPPVVQTDLGRLAFESGKGYELMFFSRLKQELDEKLGESPQILHFKGLRGCVKQLIGARRWSGRCQQLNDQIVNYLRVGWERGKPGDSCALLVE
jgi:hypothetical protein